VTRELGTHCLCAVRCHWHRSAETDANALGARDRCRGTLTPTLRSIRAAQNEAPTGTSQQKDYIMKVEIVCTRRREKKRTVEFNGTHAADEALHFIYLQCPVTVEAIRITEIAEHE
jgi:hypothetical protein